MTSLKRLVGFLQKLHPVEYAAEWDNVGLLVEPTCFKGNHLVNNILITNDLTSKVLTEALTKNINFIISYHPPIFGKGFLKFKSDNIKQRIILQCIENSIAIYSPHTACDCARNGVNDWLIDVALGKQFDSNDEQKIITVPAEVSKHKVNETLFSNQKVGFGRIYENEGTNFQTLQEVIKNIKNGTKTPNLSLSKAYSLEDDIPNNEVSISSIAVCAGSGATVLRSLAGKVDLLVSGEMSHHEVLNFVENGTSVILTNHTNSERGYLEYLRNYVLKEFKDSNLKVDLSTSDYDPQRFV